MTSILGGGYKKRKREGLLLKSDVTTDKRKNIAVIIICWSIHRNSGIPGLMHAEKHTELLPK
jgi:hypothetical protein